MSDSITIGTKSFPIGQTEEDQSRRRKYFTNGKGDLTANEEGLLAALGIDEEMIDSYKLWLPDFFTNLPGCETDTSLILSKGCEIPHYILWSVMFRSNQETQARIAKDRSEHKSLNDLETAKTEEVVKAFQTSGSSFSASSDSSDSSDSSASSDDRSGPVSPTSPTTSPGLSPPASVKPKGKVETMVNALKAKAKAAANTLTAKAKAAANVLQAKAKAAANARKAKADAAKAPVPASTVSPAPPSDETDILRIFSIPFH